jgi:hypothetical protein
MRRSVVVFLIAALALTGCAPDVETQQGRSDTGIDVAALDTGLTPEGPDVGELIAVTDFETVLGAGDLTLTNAT